MNKKESKYFQTAEKIDLAFLDLLEKKDFEYITVKDICLTAGVNRSTFYLHYRTLDDLLEETNDYMLGKFFLYFSKDKIDITKASREDTYFITQEYLRPYLTFIKEYQKLFKIATLRFNTLKQDDNFSKLKNHILFPILTKHGVKVDDQNYVLMFHLEGIHAIIKLWLKNNCQKSIDDIITIIENCIKNPQQ